MRRRVAVLLNRRAQGVTRSRLRWFREHVSGDDLFVTEDDPRPTIREIATRGYEVLCLGGGDGTFMEAAEALRDLAHVPILFPLRLGTGNATHDLSGSSPPTKQGLARDLARAADPDEVALPLRLLDVNGRLAQFAGVGLDAEWAADYAWLIKKHVGTGRLLPLVRGVPGYVLTAATMTIPRLLRRPQIEVRVISRGPATRLDTGAELDDGAVIYEGRCVMVSASTVPSYSAGLRFFRHVETLADAFELKIAVARPIDVLRRAGRVLRGEPDPSIIDVAAREVTIELAVPTRYHIGGDVLAAVREIIVRTSPCSVPVLRA